MVEKHLRFCSSCADENKKLLMISSLMDKVPIDENSPYFTEKTINRIKVTISERRKYHVLRPVLASLLSIGILIGTMIGSHVSKETKANYYHYLKNFDDFPPESLSRIYLGGITGASK
jgi:hypothetical protein